MKNKNFFRNAITIIGISISSAFAAQAVIIVDNNPTAPVAQNDLQAAIDNAPAGSTIYLQPSPTSYGSVTLTKNINLVGRSSSETGYVSTVSQIYIQAGSSNSSFKGLEVSSIGQNTHYTTDIIENISIKECKVNSITVGDYGGAIYSKGKNWTIEGNNIDAISGYFGIENLIVRNNLISSLSFYEASSIFVAQNIFKPGNVYIQNADINNSGTILNISNSIFLGNSTYTGATCNLSGKVNLQNCLSYDYGGGTYTFTDVADSHTVVFTGMLYNQNPLFVSVNPNAPSTQAEYSIANYGFNYLTDDLHLQAGSPAKLAGQGGVDLGIYHNYDFRNAGNPFGIPTMKITNAASSVPAGSNLQITITAKAQ